MFASFLWTVLFVTVCRADGSAMEHRLKPFWAPGLSAALSEVARRREGDDEPSALEDGVTTMSAQAGFRYRQCIKASPIRGFTKMILGMWAPAILGEIMDFSTDERRRWGFNKNNFITNIAEPMEGVACASTQQVCTIKAMRLFNNRLVENQSNVLSKYFPFVTSDNIEFFVGCAYEEIPRICNEYKTLMCSEGEN